MPPKRKTSSSASSSSYSSSSSSTNCDTIPTIKQRFGTCWFNAILTCLLYGDKSKKLFRRKLNKQQFQKLIKIYDDKIEKTEEDESYMQKTFKLFSAKQSLQDVQELFLKIIAYTEQTNIDFDLAIHLLIALNSYDSNIFTIQPIADEQNSHIFAVCPPNIHMQVKYSLNIYKMFGIKALVIQKTLKKKIIKENVFFLTINFIQVIQWSMMIHQMLLLLLMQKKKDLLLLLKHLNIMISIIV